MNIEMIDGPSTELTVIARAALALGSDKARTELAALVLKSAAIVSVKNQAGREECHRAYMTLVKGRTNIERIGLAARQDATAFSKAVIAEENSLLEITTPEEKRLLALRDGWDADRAAEKVLAENNKRERIASIQERIAAIKAFVGLALECRTAAAVSVLMDKLSNDPLQGMEEFEGEARMVRLQVMLRLGEIHAGKVAGEADRARIKAELEEEAARLAAERDALARAEAEAKAAREAEEADMARKRAVFMAELEAAAKAKREAEVDRRVQADADAAELRRQRALLAVENERINAERAAWAKEIEQRNAEAQALETVGTLTEPAPYIVEAVEPATTTRLHIVPSPPSPTDDEIMSVAVYAVCDAYSMPLDEASARLACIVWIPQPETA